MTLNCFAAADRLVVPLQCEYYALEGIAMLTRVINQVRENGINPGLEILGVVMTMFDSRTRLAQSVVAEVRQHFGEKVFETVIPGRPVWPRLRATASPSWLTIPTARVPRPMRCCRARWLSD